MSEKDLGQRAYEAYSRCVRGLSVRGEPLPTWDEQSFELQAAWRIVALEVSTRAQDADGHRLHFLTIDNWVKSVDAEYTRREREFKADLAKTLAHVAEVDPA
jgi:hypothetical protein